MCSYKIDPLVPLSLSQPTVKICQKSFFLLLVHKLDLDAQLIRTDRYAAFKKKLKE